MRTIISGRCKGHLPRTAVVTKLFQSFLITALSTSLGLSGCSGNRSGSENRRDRARVTLVDTAPVKIQDVQVLLRSVGSLEAVDRVEIAPEISGIVKHIHFEENQRVEKGQLLVQLDDDKLRLEVQQAQDSLATANATRELAQATIRRTEAEVENRKSKFDRDEQLYKEGVASEAVFIQSKTAYESALAAVEEAKAAYRRAEREIEAAKTRLALAKERLSDTSIAAPLSGVLGERLISPGDYVKAGQTLVELVVMAPLEISFSVPEKHGGLIKTGQTVLFNSPSVEDRTFSGETTFVSPTADPATRSIKLKARVSNERGLLQPGLFGAVRLVLETHPDAPIIPESAIVPRAEETFVYIVDDSKARLRKVILGEHFDGEIEVLEGVKAGETVITAGQQKVADDFPVRIREPIKKHNEEVSSAQSEDTP